MTNDERMQRKSNLIATIRTKLGVSTHPASSTQLRLLAPWSRMHNLRCIDALGYRG
jgi:hypothetical protein